MKNNKTKIIIENSSNNYNTFNDATGDSINNQKKINSTIPVFALSALCAAPTAFLNGLSAMSGNSGDLNNIANLSDLSKLIQNSSVITIIYAVTCLLTSETVLLFLNRKYLLNSAKSVYDLMKNDFFYIYSLFMNSNQPQNKPTLLENLLFIWCFCTSLIFAEIGSESLSWIGTAGTVIGFMINLLVYFSTRFAGARMFFEKLLSKEIENNSIVTNAKFNLQSIIGYLLTLLIIPPIMLTFIPVSIQGLQKLTQHSLGVSNDYQDVISFVAGSIFSLPTVFFYAVSAKKLPQLITNSTKFMFMNTLDKNFASSIKMLMLSLVSIGSSYCTSIGFKLVAQSAVQSGYLSYLNEEVQSIIPYALFSSVFVMFLSHLQELSNQACVAITNNNSIIKANHHRLFKNLDEESEDSEDSEVKVIKVINN